jgi:hypothetical protein
MAILCRYAGLESGSAHSDYIQLYSGGKEALTESLPATKAGRRAAVKADPEWWNATAEDALLTDVMRSIYIEVRRNFLSPLMLVFDTPVPATTVGKRSVSNVPAQALALMNDPFVTAQARAWAERVLSEVSGPLEARVERMYLLAFGRPPGDAEVSAATRFLDAQRVQQGLDEMAAWADLCHAMLNAKEFVFVE